jgi:hypothetical protein
MLKAACSRTDPKKVEAVIVVGGGVQYPLEDTCPACHQPWDASHMVVIYDDNLVAPPAEKPVKQ